MLISSALGSVPLLLIAYGIQCATQIVGSSNRDIYHRLWMVFLRYRHKTDNSNGEFGQRRDQDNHFRSGFVSNYPRTIGAVPAALDQTALLFQLT